MGEATTVKILCIIMPFILLFIGCYSHTTVTKPDTLNLDNSELTFRLTDGTSIKSSSEKHHRVENGYKVAGKLNSNQYWKDFDGMVRDEQIKDITFSEYNDDLTTIVVVGTVLVLGGITHVIVSNIWLPPFSLSLSPK